MITDAIGRAVALVLAPGQAQELPHAVALLDQLPGVPGWVAADRGYSSHGFREHTRSGLWATREEIGYYPCQACHNVKVLGAAIRVLGH